MSDNFEVIQENISQEATKSRLDSIKIDIGLFALSSAVGGAAIAFAIKEKDPSYLVAPGIIPAIHGAIIGRRIVKQLEGFNSPEEQ